MLIIEKGLRECWPNFSLDIMSDIALVPGQSYRLMGENGSGKSSFIAKLILPLLAKNSEANYRLYLEQLFHLQGYAIRAHAAINKPKIRIHTVSECLSYLLENLAEAYLLKPKPVYIVIDESQYLAEIRDFVASRNIETCLIYAQHGDSPITQPHKAITFTPLNLHRSEVNESNT